MLESLTIPAKNKKQGDLTVNHDVRAVITASNLLEVKHPDVFAVTCNPCKQFQLAQQKKYLLVACMYTVVCVLYNENSFLII